MKCLIHKSSNYILVKELEKFEHLNFLDVHQPELVLLDQNVVYELTSALI